MIKHLKSLIAPVLAAVFVASVAHGAFYQWSKTAATNATADPSINWSEGMSPSSVNDSARAMMARAAEYRDDISGSLATGGTSSAYTVTTNQGFDSTPTTGQLLAITPNATNAAGATLTADGGTAFPIQTDASTAVGAGTLVSGTPYSMKFNGTAWVLMNFYGNAYAVPLGAFIATSATSAPNSNFVLAYGQCISRTTYAAYFAIVSTTYSVCDGTTTFGVPDLRGRVVAGRDDMGGSAASRLTSTYFGTSAATLGAVGGSESQTLTSAQMPAHTHSITDPGHTHSIPARAPGGNAGVTGIGTVGPDGTSTPFTSSSGTTGISATNSTGGGTAHPIVPPTIIVNFLLRIF